MATLPAPSDGDVITLSSRDETLSSRDSGASDNSADSGRDASACGLSGSDGEAPSRARRLAWDVIAGDALTAAARGALDAVASLLSVGPGVARQLLAHFRWSPEALAAALADGRDVFELAGVPRGGAPGQPRAGRPAAALECGVCFSTVPPSGATRMPCGHAFCDDCWRGHFTACLETGGARLPCAAQGCRAACDDGAAARLLAGTPAGERHAAALASSYVDDNPRVRWCPSVPHCGRALRAACGRACEPVCACGASLCAACGAPPHAPATCAMASAWARKCRDDSETANWMAAHTRPCPKCAKPVEKAGGCNLVMCRCGQPFCWLCGGATGTAHTWTSIQGHSCGRFREGDGGGAGADDAGRATAAGAIRRFLHHFTRWDAHTKVRAMEGGG